MSLSKTLYTEFALNRKTFLGAGPMSPVSVQAVCTLANKYKMPVALIPSRRQVEAASLGGGYVNRWSTEEFVSFVRKLDKGNFVKLSRDHSGPWQYKQEYANGEKLTYSQAMSEVKESLSTDLKLGFDLIHIDPSLGLNFDRTQLQVEEDIIELLDFCASRMISPCEFEIGADEQSTMPELVSIAEEKLNRVLSTIKVEGLPKPLFYVLQTGTKVMESRNIGSFDAKLPVSGLLPASVQLPEIIRMCESHGILIKEHNADYLSDMALKWHPRFGIHAANVAPEFGVTETRAIMHAALENGETKFIDEFSAIVLEGGRWRKWMLNNSHATDIQKVEIGGHYHFSDEKFVELRKRLEQDLSKKSVNLNERVNQLVSNSIDRYLRWFGYGK